MALVNVKATAEIHIDTAKKLATVRSTEFQTEMAEQWYKLYDDWVPHNTGTLYDSVYIRPCEIEHYAEYAEYVYNRSRKYIKDPAVHATDHWDKEAAPSELPKLVKTMQKYVDKGGLNLDK